MDSEAEDDAAVDEAVDPILPYIGDVQENVHDPDAPISTATLLAQLDEVSVERRTQVAQTQAEFDELIKELDRLDRNRERRERYHEILQDEYIPGGEEFYSGRILPAALDSPESKLVLRGMCKYCKKIYLTGTTEDEWFCSEKCKNAYEKNGDQ